MKFSLGFSALALAADHEAPVISLDLSHMLCTTPSNCPNTGTFGDFNLGQNTANNPTTQAFSDECEVTQNGGDCVEPVASAVDHHDSNVSVLTSYTLFVRALPKTGVEKCSSQVGKNCFTTSEYSGGFDATLRSEYIIKYEATDSSGNDAEVLTFALIIRDEVSPVCHTASPSPGCISNGTESYRTYTNGDVEIEYCDSSRSPETIVWGTEPMVFDAVDGVLSKSDSKMEFSLTGATFEWAGNELSLSNADYVGSQSNTYAGASYKGMQFVYSATYDDWASVFGVNNLNNVKTESGTISLTDSTDPVLDSFFSTETGYECKTKFTRPVLAYADCFDDWALTQGRSKTPIAVMWDGAYEHVESDSDGYTSEVMAVCEQMPSSPCTIDIEYTATDHHGNSDTVNGSWISYDTLKPTLRITALTDNSSVQTNEEGDICAHRGALASLSFDPSDPSPQDHHHGWCETPTHAGGFITYMHTDPEDVTQYDEILDSTIIYHSAGLHTYTVILDLVSTSHYACEDLCSATADLTVSANWSTNCATGDVLGSVWDNNVVGTYHIYYQCSDVAGHAITACRTIVNQDVSKPLITVLSQADSADGHLHEEASHSRNYVDYGATCTDAVDGDLSDVVEVSGDVVNLAVLGTYKITYECKDSADNVALPNYRTVVVADRTCPYCSSADPVVDATVEASFPYTEHVITCTDTFDGELTERKTCSSVGGCLNDGVDVEHTGDYAMTWSATDANGNGASSSDNTSYNNAMGVPCDFSDISVAITVEDTKSPSIELKYKSNVIHQRHATLMEETSSVNGWTIGAVASAVSGVALLGYAATRRSNVATSVPV